MKKITLKSEDIHCNTCAKSIKAVVGTISGVSAVEVEVDTKTATVEYDDPATETQIRAAVESAGFDIQE